MYVGRSVNTRNYEGISTAHGGVRKGSLREGAPAKAGEGEIAYFKLSLTLSLRYMLIGVLSSMPKAPSTAIAVPLPLGGRLWKANVNRKTPPKKIP